jgi:lysophospholipase L1-like esterase
MFNKIYSTLNNTGWKMFTMLNGPGMKTFQHMYGKWGAGFLKVTFIALCISLFTFSMAQVVNIEGEVRMLALGDSYTIGESVPVNGRWPHQLIGKIRTLGAAGPYPDYIARTGWTTQNLIQGIESLLDEEKNYNLVSILIGVNNQYQGIPIDSYEPDLREIIERALGIVDHDTSSILILSIPDYAYTPFGNGNTVISQEIDQYNAIKKKVAEEYGISFFDITPISREGLNDPDLVAVDLLHPSEKQYGLWVEAILPRIGFGVSLSDGEHNLRDDQIKIYPNPASTSIQIDTSLEVNHISIYNTMGQLVLDQAVDTIPVQLDLLHLRSGMYALWVYHNRDEMVTRKTLIIQSD